MTTTDELVAVLAKVDLFDGLDTRLLRRIADSGRVETFAPGATVLSEGEEVSGFRSFSPKGVEMHVVLAGSATAGVPAAPAPPCGPASTARSPAGARSC